MRLNLSEDEIGTILGALEYEAEDLEYRSRNDRGAIDEEKKEYEAAARKSRTVINRIEKECALARVE